MLSSWRGVVLQCCIIILRWCMLSLLETHHIDLRGVEYVHQLISLRLFDNMQKEDEFTSPATTIWERATCQLLKQSPNLSSIRQSLVPLDGERNTI